jgi:quercetin dioxygenase-like cupin family protein
MYQVKLDANAIAWTPTNAVGLSMKILHHDESTGGVTSLTQLAPGSSLPAHRHTKSDQTVYVLEGDLIDDGVTYGPGTFFVAKANTPHGPHATKGGCVLLSIYTGPPDFAPAE